MIFQNLNLLSKEIKVKYKPKKNEISKYDDYVIEDNENFIVVNKPQVYQCNLARNLLKT